MKAFRTERILARIFFGRFFESDMMPAVPQVQLVIWSLAVLGAPGLMMAMRLGRAYTHAPSHARLFEAILRDQLFYLTYSMMALGFIAMLIASSYRRLVRIALETPSGGGDGRSKLFGRASKVVAAVLRPGPVQRAAGGFTLRSLGRSRTHLTLLSTYVGVAAALVVATLVPLVMRGKMSALATPSVALLSVPLVLYFFTLFGMRALFGIPAEIKANWVFRLSAPDDHIPAVIAGVRLALLLAVVAPIAIAAGLLGIAVWGPGAGAIHLGVTAVLGMLLLDVLLVGLRKIPFACTYYPGRSRAPTLWPLYVVAFVIYAYGLAAAERAAMTSRVLLGVVLAAIAAVSAGLAHLRTRNLRWPPGLIYEEEEPGRIFEGFKLSEGLAAESPAARASGPGPPFPGTNG